ncbi:Hsp20/alpha crystallin family protein [Daejeonella oryzae]|uniref:Hsp20/alpha crystallin family protein n=1 Tax=Daejeonella oryzae TaxID=1122943 RepID=UPI000478F89B|nr:Hsp20/alpha crystallin family protein [Daejeonella oryzae]
MTLVKFSNGSKGNALSPLFNDFFETMLHSDPFVSDRMSLRVPAANIAETDVEFIIELAVPGMRKDDFKISLDKNLLSISSDTKSENSEIDESKRYNRKEYSFSSFVRSFTLPQSSDLSKISAEYVDGILKIKVSKKEEAKMQSREISIQ